MIHELKIDGQVVDLMPGENITLNYRSNLFGDIDKITSSSSLTIRLPKTPRNNLFTNFSDVPYTSGCIARRWYAAEYRRNGVLLISGKATLLSATEEAYEISLVWGVFTGLQAWISSGATLRDLPLGYQTALRRYNINIFTKYMGILYGYIWYYNWHEQYAFPVVQVRLIFNTILAAMGDSNIDTSGVDLTPLNDYYINFNDDLVDELVTDDNLEPNFIIKDYLPEIKQVDFVKAICHIMGWYFTASKDGKIKLVAIDDAIDSSRSVDWSDKLSGGSIPSEVEYNFNDHAQRNWMRYKEDETVTTKADGFFPVNDRTLDVDKTLFTLPFAPSDGDYLGRASIRQYLSTIDEEGDVSTEFVKTEPRILLASVDGKTVDGSGKKIPSLSFPNDFHFLNILGLRYKNYRGAVNVPLVITVELRLTEFDLADIDFATPIYLSQYGSHFAIIELQNTGYFTTAKLIKIS